MLLKALDAEALFTLAAGLKPMSSVGSTRYIGPGKPGAFALLRDWYYRDTAGPCAPENVRVESAVGR